MSLKAKDERLNNSKRWGSDRIKKPKVQAKPEPRPWRRKDWAMVAIALFALLFLMYLAWNK